MPVSDFSASVKFVFTRMGEKLWIKPLLACLLSVAAAFIAQAADGTRLVHIAPNITSESIETLLSIMATSMLVIATLAVASMVSAYSSASGTASPRAFPLVIADDVSQYALSAFVGTFIFSIVGLIAVQNGYYNVAGRFVLFLLTILVFGIVIFTFVTWIDRIARLGRLEMTIDKVAKATEVALQHRINAPFLGGIAAGPYQRAGKGVFSSRVGYVQYINMSGLQTWAEQANARIEVMALSGTFVVPGRALAYIHGEPQATSDQDISQAADHFIIGGKRSFEDDPRYGLVVLSEIADRALSPGVNDPGTAMDVIGVFVRLFHLWGKPRPKKDTADVFYDRVLVPGLSIEDMFDDAFTSMERDGAGFIEVVTRLEKSLSALASLGDPPMQHAAMRHAARALVLAEKEPHLPVDLDALRELASFALTGKLVGKPP